MEHAVGVAEEAGDGDLAGAVILVRDGAALAIQDLARLLENVAGTELGHGDHAIAALGAGGQMILTRGRRHAHSEAA